MKEKILIWLERYLASLARSVLATYKPIIVGITGSVGKTTTRQAVYHVLKTNDLSVSQTEGNLNSELGVALAVLGFDHSPAIWEWPFAFIALNLNWLLLQLKLSRLPDYFVIEMGIDRLGDMDKLVKLAPPTIGVLTWIGEGHHLEFLKDPETIAGEKGKLLAALPKDGLAIIPAKEPQRKKLEQLATAPIVHINETGIAAAEAVAIAVAEQLGLTKEQATKALKTFKPPKGRLHQLKGINGSAVLDDTYNASFPAMKLALNTLKNMPAKRRIAVLGDVLEQGKDEMLIHEAIATLAKKEADLFIGVGKRMEKTKPDQWYASPESAAIALADQIKKDDLILVKGSQGMRMEKVSFALAADKNEAKQQLPRQNKRWQQIPFRNP
jgi:UDP-N-acetylmuramoyl-tripeptide--D-alanyl-D-alanine ligase